MNGKTIIATISIIFITALFFGCGGQRVTNYEEARITSVAWAGDTLVAYSKNIERGFVAGGIRRNPKQSVELWLAKVNPQSGRIDTTYRIRQVPADMGRIEFFPGGNVLLYAARDGVREVDLTSGELEDFFTHPSIDHRPEEIDVGPGEDYVAIVVDADVTPGSEGLMDLFMVDVSNKNLIFHSDSLVDSQSFAWLSEDCIVYITPDPWEKGKHRIMQFGVNDCIKKPSELTEEEVRCNCPKPRVSASGRFEGLDDGGKLLVREVSD